MKRDIIEINAFMVIIEQSFAQKPLIETCGFEEDVLGMAFYGSGNVALEIEHQSGIENYRNTTGMSISFYANQNVTFYHTISEDRPLQCVMVVAKLKDLHKMSEHEQVIYKEYLKHMIDPQSNFVEGPNFYMPHEMQQAVHKIFNNNYSASARMLFLRSQATELLAHFFALLSNPIELETKIHKEDRERLYRAKSIIVDRMDSPPSLSELSQEIGLNEFKLKKQFKELFGMPVFKYLQNERLSKANSLLSEGNVNIQEVAWQVGYESLSSFSNAYLKKYGYRPSENQR